jgi:hypothetical protein
MKKSNKKRGKKSVPDAKPLLDLFDDFEFDETLPVDLNATPETRSQKSTHRQSPYTSRQVIVQKMDRQRGGFNSLEVTSPSVGILKHADLSKRIHSKITKVSGVVVVGAKQVTSKKVSENPAFLSALQEGVSENLAFDEDED